MVNVSIHDDKPYVFFNQTLFGLSFIFNGHKYYSVRECYIANRTINMWIPETIPLQQRSNINSDYFVIDDSGTCLCRDRLSHVQFDTYVQAYLFRKYYEQVFCEIDELDMFRYVNAYNACVSITDNIQVTCDIVKLTEYDKRIYCNEIILNISKKINGISLDNIKILHIDCDSLLNVKNLRTWIKFNSVCLFNIYLEEHIDDIPYQVLLVSDYDNVFVIRGNLDMNCDKKVVSIGNMMYNGKLDWNNLLILDGDL